MKSITLAIVLNIVFSSFSCLRAQVPDLGSVTNFVLFTSAGAVGSTGISNIAGNVGTNVGAITGFEGISGTVYNADAITAQAVMDVASAYNQLFNTPATFTAHAPVFGNGETLFAGVYSIGGAASVLGSITLDAQGDPNAVFIFKSGGALTTGASTTLHLTNSALARNIFWIAEGAISMAASTTISGTFIANNGAVDMGDGSILEGRLLSTNGAVSVYGTRAHIPAYSVLALNMLSLTGNCEGADTRLTWMTTGSNINDITIQSSKDGFHWIDLKKINEGEKIWSQHTFLFADHSPVPSLSFYRLEQQNSLGIKEYGPITSMRPCALKNNNQLLIYPNPSTGILRLIFSGDSNEVYYTAIINVHGKAVYLSPGVPGYINISNLPTGVYIVRVQSASTVINHHIIFL